MLIEFGDSSEIANRNEIIVQVTVSQLATLLGRGKDPFPRVSSMNGKPTGFGMASSSILFAQNVQR
jgi:hypothetical protein